MVYIHYLHLYSRRVERYYGLFVAASILVIRSVRRYLSNAVKTAPRDLYVRATTVGDAIHEDNDDGTGGRSAKRD